MTSTFAEDVQTTVTFGCHWTPLESWLDPSSSITWSPKSNGARGARGAWMVVSGRLDGFSRRILART